MQSEVSTSPMSLTGTISLTPFERQSQLPVLKERLESIS